MVRRIMMWVELGTGTIQEEMGGREVGFGMEGMWGSGRFGGEM
jgi:hypothetical protein